MRITIVYRYFWPDTPPYANMLRDISRWLSEAGHDIQILTAQPAYKTEFSQPKRPKYEVVDGVKVRRIALIPEKGRNSVKAINALLFIVQAFFIVLGDKKSDVVWTATIPPVLQGFMMMIAAKLRGSQFLYHMQDIHPEVSIVGNVMKDGLAAKVMRWLDTFTLNRTNINVLLSEDMRGVIDARGAKPKKTAIINNYAWAMSPHSTETKSSNGPVRFVFAGNVGRFQYLEKVLRVFAQLDPSSVELHIMGEGKAKRQLIELTQEIGCSHIHFHAHQPSEIADQFIRTCDVGLVTLAPGVYKYAFPSKVWGYMAADLRILCIVEENSSLAKLVSEERLGISVDPSTDESDLGNRIESFVHNIQANRNMVESGSGVHKPEYARQKWVAMFERLGQEELQR